MEEDQSNVALENPQDAGQGGEASNVTEGNTESPNVEAREEDEKAKDNKNNEEQDAQPLRQIDLKLVVLGESSVGKSTFVLRFVKNEFHPLNPTVGAAFLTKKMMLPDRIVKFDIWDTAGQERFHSLTPMYYRNAKAVIVTYDICSTSSFLKAKNWVNDIEKQTGTKIIMTIIGTKLDEASTGRQVSTAEAEEYAKSVNASFFETSAKDNINVTEVFADIGSRFSLDDIFINTRANPSEGAQRHLWYDVYPRNVSRRPNHENGGSCFRWC